VKLDYIKTYINSLFLVYCMLNTWPSFKTGEVNEIFKTFPATEQKIIDEYLQYRKARGNNIEGKLLDIRRGIIQVIRVLGKDYKNLGISIDYKNINTSNKENIPLKTLRNLIAVINTVQNNSWKNKIKCDLRLFLKFKFKDWSIRFNDFDDITITAIDNSKRINSGSIYNKDQVKKLISHEGKMFYKSFIATQYEAGLRTGEVRLLKWSDIKFNVDEDISEVTINATKTGKTRTVFIKDATFYLKKLKEEQENSGQRSVYVFPSKKDINKPCNKATINLWFGLLTQKALGKKGWPYLMRHSKATELYTLADEGKISDATASRFMGHSKNMKNVYQHCNAEKIKQMLKDQIYHLEELPPEKKAEYEKKLGELNEKYELLAKVVSDMAKKDKKFMKTIKK